MARRLLPSETIAAGIRRIVLEQLDTAIGHLDALTNAEGDQFDVAVHEMRKRCKEVRGLLVLLGGNRGSSLGKADAGIRRAASMLSAARDAQVQAETLLGLRATSPTVAVGEAEALDQLVEEQRRRAADVADIARTDVTGVEAARRELVKARRRVEKHRPEAGTKAVSDALASTYRKGRRRHRAAAAGDDEAAHEWRKSVKQLWYQMRVLKQTAPSVLEPMVTQLDDLGEALGIDHDLAVLVEHLERRRANGTAAAVEQATVLARIRQHELRRVAIRTGHTLYAERPDEFARRLRTYWRNAVRLGPELAFDEDGNEQSPIGSPRSGSSPDLNAATVASAASSTMEHERKFLIEDSTRLDLGRLDPSGGTRIMQGYLLVADESSTGSVSVRLREDGRGRRRLTIKGGHGASRTEVELDLDHDAFDALWPYAAGRRVDKIRYRHSMGEHVAEIDVFEGALDGLRLVEVEFPEPSAMAAFEPPEWFGSEVTDDPRYRNDSLARS